MWAAFIRLGSSSGGWSSEGLSAYTERSNKWKDQLDRYFIKGPGTFTKQRVHGNNTKRKQNLHWNKILLDNRPETQQHCVFDTFQSWQKEQFSDFPCTFRLFWIHKLYKNNTFEKSVLRGSSVRADCNFFLIEVRDFTLVSRCKQTEGSLHCDCRWVKSRCQTLRQILTNTSQFLNKHFEAKRVTTIHSPTR
jgi:hypothetical protein